MTARENAHLDPGLLVEYQEQGLDEQAHAEVRAHLEACGRCSAELALVQQYLSVAEDAALAEGQSEVLRSEFRERLQHHQAASQAVRTAPPRTVQAARGIPTRRWGIGVLVAASLALIVLAATQFRYGPLFTGEEPELRATDAAQWTAGLAVVKSDDGALELRWPVRAGVEDYRVLVLDARGNTIYEAASTTSPHRIEASVREGLTTDGPYFAAVEFVERTGEVVRSSPRVLPLD